MSIVDINNYSHTNVNAANPYVYVRYVKQNQMPFFQQAKPRKEIKHFFRLLTICKSDINC